jgi:hypothetical protein
MVMMVSFREHGIVFLIPDNRITRKQAAVFRVAIVPRAAAASRVEIGWLYQCEIILTESVAGITDAPAAFDFLEVSGLLSFRRGSH